MQVKMHNVLKFLLTALLLHSIHFTRCIYINFQYLKSVKHLMTEDKYKEVEKLADDFTKGVGNRLQRYLIAKSWWATNYVSLTTSHHCPFLMK